MEELSKLAKNQTWFKPIIQKARINYKNAANLKDFDQNKMNRKQFVAVLQFVSKEAELMPPTKQQANQLFDEFNDLKNGRQQQYIQKQQYEKLCTRIIQMLNSTIQN